MRVRVTGAPDPATSSNTVTARDGAVASLLATRSRASTCAVVHLWKSAAGRSPVTSDNQLPSGLQEVDDEQQGRRVLVAVAAIGAFTGVATVAVAAMPRNIFRCAARGVGGAVRPATAAEARLRDVQADAARPVNAPRADRPAPCRHHVTASRRHVPTRPMVARPARPRTHDPTLVPGRHDSRLPARAVADARRGARLASRRSAFPSSTGR